MRQILLFIYLFYLFKIYLCIYSQSGVRKLPGSQGGTAVFSLTPMGSINYSSV